MTDKQNSNEFLSFEELNESLANYCYKNDSIMVQRCIEQGASPNYKLPDGDTMLAVCVRGDAYDALSELLRQGAKINKKEKFRYENSNKRNDKKIDLITLSTLKSNRIRYWHGKSGDCNVFCDYHGHSHIPSYCARILQNIAVLQEKAHNCTIVGDCLSKPITPGAKISFSVRINNCNPSLSYTFDITGRVTRGGDIFSKDIDVTFNEEQDLFEVVYTCDEATPSDYKFELFFQDMLPINGSPFTVKSQFPVTIQELDCTNMSLTDYVGWKPFDPLRLAEIIWSALMNADEIAFESFCKIICGNMLNLHILTTKRSHDGGIDLIMSQNKERNQIISLAQCKKQKNVVSVDEIRKLVGSREIYAKNLSQSIDVLYFFTTSFFAAPAREAAQTMQIQLYDKSRIRAELAIRGNDILHDLREGGFSIESSKCENTTEEFNCVVSPTQLSKKRKSEVTTKS